MLTSDLDLRLVEQQLIGTAVAGPRTVLVQRSECVPNVAGSKPMLATQSCTNRAYGA